MEPFSITCTTCKSRLKVKSAAAIGQVVPCPKCGGMVLVKPPEEDALRLFRGSDGADLGTVKVPAGCLQAHERRNGDWGRCAPVLRKVQDGL